MDDNLFVQDMEIAMHASAIHLIMDRLRHVIDTADLARELVNSEGFYKGDALPVLQKYYDSLSEHAMKLWNLHHVGELFLWQVIDDFGKADGDLLRVLDQLSLEQRR